jgi:hypothetical protein
MQQFLPRQWRLPGLALLPVIAFLLAFAGRNS